jgi:hypothetical protein
MTSDTCHFCGSPDACYQKLYRGAWRDTCWSCIQRKKTEDATSQPQEDFSDLNDPPDPVDPTHDQKRENQKTLF